MAPDQTQRSGADAGLRRAGTLQAWHWPLLVGLAAAAISMSFPYRLVGDGDTQMHIEVGRWIIAHHAIPFHDPYSFTFPGKLWVPHEWGAALILDIAYAALGWGGVIAITGLAIFAAFAILTRALLRYFAPPRAAIAATLAFILTEEHLLARPHILALPLMVLWMSGIIAARDEARAPPLKLLPAMVLWCNLHGGFVVGLGFCALLGGEAVIEAHGRDRIAIAGRWGLFFVLAVLCTLISPNGIEGLIFPFQLVGMTYSMGAITEWQGANFSSYQPLEVWIVLIVLLGLSLGLRLTLTRAAMVVLLLHMALSHVRNAELLGFITPLLVAAPLGAHLRALDQARQATARSAVAGPGPTRRAVTVTTGLIALGFFAVAALLDLMQFRPAEKIAPVLALDAVRAQGVTGRVLNLYNLGGFLILHGVPVFIDGRADLYGDDFVRQYVEAVNGGIDKTLRDMLDRYQIQWTIFEPNIAAVHVLDRLPDWQRVYADEFTVVHRRIAPPSQRSLTPSDGTHADSK